MKNKKMDPNFVSSELWELKYVAKKFGVSVEMVRSIKRLCYIGKSRRKLYAKLKNK